MTALERARATARRLCPRVVFPEWDEPRIIAARARLEIDGQCQPVPLEEIAPDMVEHLACTRDLAPPVAHRMLSKPLIRAAAMVATGRADLMVAGVNSPTRKVIEAAALAIGLSAEISKPSSIFYMLFPDGREFVFADCAVNVAPDAADLADIARISARSATALLGEARVALLSFSTDRSGSGASVETVRAAAAATGFAGPVQADAALNATIAATKGMAPIAANTLIFPSLDAGNIAYKLCQELAGARAIGPLLQGFRKPVCDLSRGARVEDIIAATLVTIAMTAP